MPNKILSQSGVSLADTYDIEGSIAGVEELDSDAVKTVHEMGGTIWSERLVGQMVIIPVTALAQTLNFSANFSFAENVRLLGLQVISDDAARVLHAQVSITSPPALDNQDTPIFYWEDAKDTFRQVRLLTAGVVATEELLVPELPPQLPQLLVGQASRRPTSTVSFRGTSVSFGAGTVDVRVQLYVAFAQSGTGDSSYGLPVPSW